METKTVFKLLKHLTSQTTTSDLVSALIEILAGNFSGVQLVVYELQSARSGGRVGSNIVCLDTLQEKKPIYLDDDPVMTEAHETKDIVEAEHEIVKRKVVMPIELYDKSISHLVVLVHPYREEKAVDLLLGLLDIFTDVFRNIHEKGYDPLTRIFNRQAFDQVVSDLAYASSMPVGSGNYGKSFSSIAILDIDKFKSINDQYGHSIGDETLVLFAQTIRSVLRREDLFFRYGGEEFVVFIKKTNHEQTLSILERCREATETRRIPQVGNITVSIGVADLSGTEPPLDTLSKADKALYYIKNNGRNQVQTYENLLEQGLLEPVIPTQGSADFWDDE